MVICGVIGSMVELTSSLTTLIGALDNKDVSARELLAMHLDRVDKLDGAINSVVTLAPERAEVEAAQIDQARASGEQVGRLAGVPVTIKDALATEGIRSTGGAVELRDFVPDTDAVVVDTVRTEGAVVFGKTNIPRWSGDYQSYNELFGTTNNPWDITRTPGGSSGRLATTDTVQGYCTAVSAGTARLWDSCAVPLHGIGRGESSGNSLARLFWWHSCWLQSDVGPCWFFFGAN